MDDCVACLAESGVTPFGGNQPVITPATLLYWLDQQLPFLSGGERQKVRLALAFSLQPQVLLLDEPGNDLDSAGRAWLAGKLTAWRGCVLLVSHQPALLRSADGILELSGRQIKYYGTGYDDYLLIRQQEQQAQQQRLDHLRPADHAQSTVAAES
ncbi:MULTISPECIES: ATP-binding cassette domain-containing protein [unclassified Thalassolituus]|uniref:ATP-binding cassette domain-containing protein n=1 Tax=unclassified Thalassolituus TaxID=2624967 RepID=UPI0025E1A1B7|nr:MULTISPECIES: ATP-binding cassette domain-containing protein [unclassified Thalassolituus]